jgi:hypothetical protein
MAGVIGRHAEVEFREGDQVECGPAPRAPQTWWSGSHWRQAEFSLIELYRPADFQTGAETGGRGHVHDGVPERRRHPSQGLDGRVRQGLASFGLRLVGGCLPADLALASNVGAIGLLKPDADLASDCTKGVT